MRSWNQVELIGHLTHDPELHKTTKSTSVCGFSVATNRSRVDETGKRSEDTSYHRIISWGPLAEQCAKLLKKGSFVFVSGRLSYRSYTTKDAEKRDVTKIMVNDMVLLDKKTQAPPPTASGGTAEEIYSDEDIPENLPF